jgi:hypothetical protein
MVAALTVGGPVDQLAYDGFDIGCLQFGRHRSGNIVSMGIYQLRVASLEFHGIDDQVEFLDQFNPLFRKYIDLLVDPVQRFALCRHRHHFQSGDPGHLRLYDALPPFGFRRQLLNGQWSDQQLQLVNRVIGRQVLNRHRSGWRRFRWVDVFSFRQCTGDAN